MVRRSEVPLISYSIPVVLVNTKVVAAASASRSLSVYHVSTAFASPRARHDLPLPRPRTLLAMLTLFHLPHRLQLSKLPQHLPIIPPRLLQEIYQRRRHVIQLTTEAAEENL